MKTTLSFLLVFFFQYVSAQTLIPYLGPDGQYGYADENGKVLIKPQYNALDIMPAGVNTCATQKFKEKMLLLRNGKAIPGTGELVRVVNFEGDKYSIPDTLRNLWIVNTKDRMVLVNHKTGISRRYNPSSNYDMNPSWFPVEYDVIDHIKIGKFQKGVCRVYRDRNTINFVDTSLTEIFPRDYAAGVALDDGYFLLGDKNRKLGVADRSGKIRLPLEWNSLEPAGRAGHFIVNNPSNASNQIPVNRAGVIDADGRLVIDTMHFEIEAAGKEALIISNKTHQGVMDFAGNWVLPQQFEKIDYLFNDLLLVKLSDSTWNVYHTKGEKKFKKDYQSITQRGRNPPFLRLKDGPLCSMADATAKILFTDTLGDINTIPVKMDPSKPYFHILDKVCGQGIADATGRVVVPAIYDDISVLNYQLSNLLVAKKDSLRGLFTPAGKAVLPVQFSSIRIETGDKAGQDTIIWARPAGSKRYSAFDITGQKMPAYPDNVFPNRDPEVILSATHYTNRDEVMTMDGNTFLISNTNAYQNLIQSRTPDGGFLVGESIQFMRVMNAFLKDILPQGFVAPADSFNRENLRKTDLLAVYQLPADFVPGQAVSREKVLKGANAKIQKFGFGNSWFVNYSTGDLIKKDSTAGLALAMPARYEACGVINARGEWVIEPKKDARFIPMSYHWVKEISMQGDTEIVRMHRVHHPQKKVFKVDHIGYDMFGAHNNFNMRIGQKTSDTTALRFAYVNGNGDQLTGFNILRGERHLKHRNLATILNEKGKLVDVILDEKGQVLVELQGLEARPQYEDSSDWNVRYLVVKKQGGEDFGLIDSTGKRILRFKFNKLRILKNDRLLACENAEGLTEIRNWKGKRVFSFTQKVHPECFQTFSRYLLVSSEDMTAVITPDGKLLRSFPGKVVGVSNVPEYPDLVSVFDPVLKKPYWVHLISGLAFRG